MAREPDAWCVVLDGIVLDLEGADNGCFATRELAEAAAAGQAGATVEPIYTVGTVHWHPAARRLQ